MRYVMWRIFIGAALLSLAALPAASQSLPSKKEAAVLLQKAADATDLRASLKAVSLSLEAEPPPLFWPVPMRAAVADSEVQAEFSDFTDVGEKRYPRHIKLREFGDAVEMRVDVLDRVAKFDPDVFVPPRESIARDWCSEPVVQGTWPDPQAGPALITRSPLRFIPYYYVLVGRDGRVEKSAPLHPTIKGLDSQVESWLAGVRYPVNLCNGKPIEYETVIHPLLHIQY